MLEPGAPAPKVSTQNQFGEPVSPDFEEPTVVYFYPEDFTGGCTIEARDFQEHLPQFREGGITVYGVSMDDVATHDEFAEEEGLLYDLLADPDGAVAEAFGLDTSGGRTDRRTFVLADGEVKSVYDPAPSNPEGHAEEVLHDVRNEYVQGG
ncbi:peroxiredoxin [Haloarcula hispanica N601]|uniref:thioredoxin-dependent peroxiredoxin n=2 Tax=Haloarcula hispanica TaxID=51589 RepID=V5TJ65_HALHI|nr:peroxiredoxin [Haloarcula hispanica]AEM56210.1 bacterioferritin comigratory protein / alkyl hydroperoxide reductase / peroxiredoxin-like protein [Haloarcula hispanica ATCC 33960]AHB65022.1 peroxiredoxin [Haloarcula hispanica N601]